MAEQMSVMTERVDDIPLLLVHSDKMGVPELLDTYFKPHGNWEGMSLGWTTAGWLAHILSEGDHRMNQVQAWAAHRVHTLSTCTGQLVNERGFSDDRLALVLDAPKPCWVLLSIFMCPSSSLSSSFTVISSPCQPYSSTSYPCWTFRQSSMTSSLLNLRNLPENDRTMRTYL